MQRVMVSLVLAGSAAATASLVGFAGGAAARAIGIEAVNPVLAALMVAAAIGLDLVVRPPAVRRQVPQLWGRVFSAPTAALLYGARLGPGPLTILSTWLWWAAVAIGLSLGPWAGALVGAVFGAGRVAAMVVVGTRAGRWRRHERRAAVCIAVVVLVTTLAVSAVAPQPATRAATPTITADEPPARPAPSAPSPLPNTGSTAPDTGLGGRLPEALPGSYRRVADDPAKGLGPLDLAAAAALEADPQAETSLLETRHFAGGHARAWRRPDGTTAYVAVYRFASAADAAAYRLDGSIILEGRGARQYPVDAVFGGGGFSQADDRPTGGTISHGVTFVEGADFLLVIVTGGPDAQVGPGDAAVVAGVTAQAGRLGQQPGIRRSVDAEGAR